MKKFVKMSLVAAIAVAGTTASAQPLAEAIKNVDVSGTATYRYDDRDKNDSNKNTNSYKISINTKSKVNDDVTFNVKTIVGSGDANGNPVEINTSGSDGVASVTVTQANFAYTGFANTTIIAGKQAVPSPFAVQADSMGDEDFGNGLTAIVNVGPVTLAGTYLQDTNLTGIGGQDVAGLGVMGSAGPVALDAWYLDVKETAGNGNNGAKAYTFGASGKVAMVSLFGRYSAVDYDATNDTQSLWKIGAKAKFGIVGLGLSYGQTNDVTNFTNKGVNLTGDTDAEVGFSAWKYGLDTNDSDLLIANVNVDATSTINLSATYADKDGNKVKANSGKEYYGQVTYKMSKNLKSYVRLGKTKDDGKDRGTRGRLNIQYSF